MVVTVIYEDLKDRELLNLIKSKSPVFINYVDAIKEKKEAYAIKSHWAARLNPFVVVEEDDKIIKVFYSEVENAVQQLISYLND